MKALKKIGSLLLVVMLVFSMATMAFAAEGEYTITIKSDVSGHTYEAYQIFSGTLGDYDTTGKTGGVLGQVEWGTGIDQTQLTDGKLEGKTAAEWAEALGDGTISGEEFAAKVGKILSGTKLTLTENKNDEGTTTGYSTTHSAPGYYLIKDADDSLKGKDDSYTEFILQVTGDVEVEPKSDVPSLDKKVEDKNDTEGGEGTWGETADHDIGDHVNFELIATLPSNFGEYAKYKMVFTDTMEKGLTYDKNAKVYVVNGEEEIEITASVVETEDGFTVTIDDLKAAGVTVTSASKVVVKYSATLNEDAVIGATGNKNTAGLEYSNNPNQDASGTPETGKTPDDSVIVFTYEFDVNKVDENRDPLAGAGFTLYKKIGGNWVAVKFELNDAGKYVVAGYAGDEGITAEDCELGAGTLTSFDFGGLDDGEYKLEETTVPDGGYNKAADIEFKITAEHDDKEEKLVKVEFKDADDSITSSTVGVGSTDVVNRQGSRLPSTGGIGTTLFYIVGGVLVVGTGVLLIVKRRMRNEG